MTTEQWKPVYLILRGDRQKSLQFRKFAEKLLARSKERNEKLGHYKNPVYNYKDAQVRIRTNSLPGYDIVEIETTGGGGRELNPNRKLYSGLCESRYNPAGLAWYLRYYPADYELDTENPAHSIDGTAVDPVMPPNRRMYNNYDGNPTEMPWFDSKYEFSPVAGRFSGQLRRLVQLQLGMNMAVGFSYTSEGLKVIDNGDGSKDLWLYSVGGGVFKQHLFTYTEEAIKNAMSWLAVPQEIQKLGWFAPGTQWDNSKPVMTYDQWNAIHPEIRPDEKEVTFQLQSASAFNATISGYGALGDYGWSFNSDCSAACFAGVGYNHTDSVPATNYQAQLFITTINEEYAEVTGQGRVLFVHESTDQIKVPDTIGGLRSISLWRTEGGYNASQPGSGYMAPHYAYFDLNDDMQVVYYTYTSGYTGTINNNTGNYSAAFVNCREPTAYAPTTNHSFQACTTARSGTGTEGRYHGFVSQLYEPDETAAWVGREFEMIGLTENRNYYWYSGWIKIPTGTGYYVPGMMPFATHTVRMFTGTASESTKSCVVIPSFERLGIYHYKLANKIMDGEKDAGSRLLYELGSGDIRRFGCKCISACGYSNCALATPADAAPPEYQSSRYAWVVNPIYGGHNVYSAFNPSCVYSGNTYPCWQPDFIIYDYPVSPLFSVENPFSQNKTTYSGTLVLPDGQMKVFSEDEILNQSHPFELSNDEYGIQSVVSAFDTLSGRWIFSMPEIGISPIVSNIENDEYPTSGYLKPWVYFVGDPGFADEQQI